MRIVNPGEIDSLPREQMPQHVALIIDGNRRWAHGRGIPRSRAHDGAGPAVARTIAEASRLGIPHLTIFGMSTENLGRDPDELRELAWLDHWLWPHPVIRSLNDANAEVRLAGDVDDPRYYPEAFEPIRSLARHKSPQMFVTFAVNYGGRRELERAATFASGSELSAHLYSDGPDVDLLIRTSGEQRLSNFMLWQCAYAEFVFMDTLWPDFTSLHLDSAIVEYASRRRRMGL